MKLWLDKYSIPAATYGRVQRKGIWSLIAAQSKRLDKINWRAALYTKYWADKNAQYRYGKIL